MDDANGTLRVIHGEEDTIDVRLSSVVKHSNRMGGIEPLRSNRASVGMAIE